MLKCCTGITITINVIVFTKTESNLYHGSTCLKSDVFFPSIVMTTAP